MIRILFALVFVLCSCKTIENGQRIRSLRGPVKIQISPIQTIWGASPGLNVDIESGGWLLFAPQGAMTEDGIDLPLEDGE